MTSRPTITVCIRNVDGEPMLDSQAMSLLFGVPAADIQALPTAGGSSPIPRDWVRRGRRRAREAQAHTGSTAMLDALEYWADKEHGATITIVYE